MEVKLESKLEKILDYSQRCTELLEGQKVKDVTEPYRLGQDIFTLHQQIKLPNVLQNGCKQRAGDGVMMDDGRLALNVGCSCLGPFRGHGALLIYKTDESSVQSIPLQYRPRAITAVNNHTVAVTRWDTQCIDMFDINNTNKLKTIQVLEMLGVSGITTINNKLVVCGYRCLLIIDPQTGNAIKKIDSPVKFPCYLHAVNDKIYYCNIPWSDDNKLYCYHYSNNKVSTVILPFHPYSTTSLQNGSLYVVCQDCTVRHVTSDVQHYNKVKLLLSILTPLYKTVPQYKTVTSEGLESVRGCGQICYNPKQRKLITCTWGGLVTVFNEI